MTDFTPHRSLMSLHRFVDRSLADLFAPMGLDAATEGYVTVDRGDLAALASAPGDPQAVVTELRGADGPSALVIAEPTLCRAALSRIWRSDRNAGAAMTRVEGEILRQFLGRVVEHWNEGWSNEGIELSPSMSMAGSLHVLLGQVVDGRWHVARCVVRATDDESREVLGVLLFCYPAVHASRLQRQAEATTWRARIARGLGDSERARLDERLTSTLRHVRITAPVTVRQSVTLGAINSLERGDVIAFDTDRAGATSFRVLDREVTGQLASCHGQLALALTGPDLAAAGDGAAQLAAPAAAPAGAPPEPQVMAGGPANADDADAGVAEPPTGLAPDETMQAAG